jgi:transposase InsO family protein
VAVNANSLQRWHERLGHRSIDYIRRAVPGISSKEVLPFCEVCARTRSRRKGFAKAGLPVQKANKRGEHFATDTCEMPETALDGSKYFAVFVCLHTRFTFFFPLASKTQLFNKFKTLMLHLFNLLARFPAWLRCDQGTEYTNKEISTFCEEKGIEMTFSTTQNPNQNAHAENRISVLLMSVRSMLNQAGLSKRYWVYAAMYSVYVDNRVPHPSSSSDLTPIAAWRGEEASHHTDDDLRHVYVFGCACYARILDANRDKLEPNAELCIFLGINPKVRGFLLQRVTGGAIFTCRDVVFDERRFPKAPNASGVDRARVIGPSPFSGRPIVERTPPAVPRPLNFNGFPRDNSGPVDVERHERQQQQRAAAYRQQHPERAPDQHAPASDQHAPSQLRRSGRAWAPSTGFLRNAANTIVALVVAGVNAVYQDPAHRREMLIGPHSNEFMGAEIEELDALAKNNTWSMVDLPPGRKPITCRWVYKYKLDRHNEIVRWKARLVARGFQQQQGLDYNETFAAVALMKSFRIIMAYAVAQGWELHQLDVNNAFLYSVLDEEVYMVFPPGYPGPKGKCLLLRKSIYGLKQAGRNWFTNLRNELLRLGFVQLKSDPCVYVHHDLQVIISVHVDDISLFSSKLEHANKVFARLQEVFKMKSEVLNCYLGLEVDRLPNGDVKIHQQAYISRMLDKFGLINCNPSTTPLPPKQCYVSAPNYGPIPHPYRPIIGSVLYASLGTRPDAAYAINILAQFNESPSEEHWVAAKRVLRYLKGTRDHGIIFRRHFDVKRGCVTIRVYSDADWAGDKETRKSRSGYIVFINGSPVSWFSKKQTCHALSSCEAEIVAMTEAIKECMWLRSFLSELKIKFNDPIPLYVDNQAAMALSLDPVNHSGSKHIDLRYKFILEAVAKKFVVPIYVATGANIADIFTKSPTIEIFRRHVSKLVV